MTDLKTKILHMMESKDIKMIPKWKFVLYSGFVILGIVLFFLVALFLMSLVFFILAKYGFLHTPLFGLHAVFHSLSVIPVLLFAVVIIIISIIEALTRIYAFSFRKPALVILLFVTAPIVFISILINETPLHDSIYNYSQGHRLGMFSHMYDRPSSLKNEMGETVIRGIVIATTTTTATLQMFDGTTKVMTNASSSKVLELPPVGEDIVVFGYLEGDVFEAQNIRYGDEIFFQKHHSRMMNGGDMMRSFPKDLK